MESSMAFTNARRPNARRSTIAASMGRQRITRRRDDASHTVRSRTDVP